MAHWFHRNPFKATAGVNFDMKMIVTDGQAMQLCSEIRQARSRLIELISDPNNETEILENAVNSYLSLLHGFLIACDERGGESKLRHAILFRWTDSMLGNTPQAQQDAMFELISICYNFAIWHMKHAAKIAGKDNITMDEAKEVHKSLRKAAGILTWLQDKFIGQLLEKIPGCSDLDLHVLNGYINQCTAEAQEVTIARAIELKHNPSLISALANETAKIFTTAADSLASLDERKFGKWRRYLHLKSTFYLAYAHCYSGENLLSQDKCGDAIRALKESEHCYTDATTLCKEYAKMKGPGSSARPEEHLFFRKLQPIVRRTLEKCERENGFIYHQKIPHDPPQLELKATYGLVKPEEYSLPSPHPLWTPVTYSAFDISKNLETKLSKSALKAEGDLPPVTEAEVHHTINEPKTSSGCTIS